MAVKTKTEQLEEVQAAITTVLTGNQSVSILGRTFTRATLSTLRDMELQLRRDVARETRGGLRTQRGIAL